MNLWIQHPLENNKTPRYTPELFCQIVYEDYFNSNPQGSIRKKDMIEMIALKNKEIEDTISNPSSVSRSQYVDDKYKWPSKEAQYHSPEI